MKKLIDFNNHPHILEKGKSNMIIKLKNVRLAFPALFEAKTVNGEGKPAFSAAFIFAKNHPQKKEIDAAIVEVATEKWGAKAEGHLKTLKASGKALIGDGDVKAEYDGYAGNLFISARNETRPLIVDKDKTPLTAADGKPYAGCYVIASLDIWAQDNKYGKRINASLRGVQFYADGDAFAGGGAADESDFDDLSDGIDDDSDLA